MNNTPANFKPWTKPICPPCFVCHDSNGRRKRRFALPNGLAFWICSECIQEFSEPFLLDFLKRIPFPPSAYNFAKNGGAGSHPAGPAKAKNSGAVL